MHPNEEVLVFFVVETLRKLTEVDLPVFVSIEEGEELLKFPLRYVMIELGEQRVNEGLELVAVEKSLFSRRFLVRSESPFDEGIEVSFGGEVVLEEPAGLVCVLVDTLDHVGRHFLVVDEFEVLFHILHLVPLYVVSVSIGLQEVVPRGGIFNDLLSVDCLRVKIELGDFIEEREVVQSVS